MTAVQRLGLRFCLQLDLTVLHFDRVFDRLAAVLFADLLGLLLHEGRKTVEVAGDSFPGFLLGLGKRLVKLSHLIALCEGIAALHAERLFLPSGSGGRARRGNCFCPCTIRRNMTDSLDLVLRFVLRQAHSLDRKQRVLRTAVAFFANPALLAPEIAVDGIALRNFVVAEAL